MFTETLQDAGKESEYRSSLPNIMYTRHFRKATHTRKFSITTAGASGWEVREEQDSRIVRWVRYSDWHRVERARAAFALEAAILEESGWNES
jgi:hypothetical protein